MDKYHREMERFVRDVYEGERKVLVFGEGPLHARVLLISEAPGEQESLEGRPFVGRAGKSLDHFLEGAGIRRTELYASYVIKFRPTKISKAGNTVNRTPTQEEIRLFTPWLTREIEMVSPECVVTLGNVALRALTDRTQTIGSAHGQFLKVLDRPLFPMYHPASLVYNSSLHEIYEKDLHILGGWLQNSKV